MTRTRTEQYLLTAKNRFESKLAPKTATIESQFTKYNKKCKKSSKPSSSLSKVSAFESKNKISTVRETLDYNTTNLQKKSSVKVEYASTLGPSESKKTLITKWVDYSSKYGIGYKLSNGCYGVLYNDSTKMLLNENCFDFLYVKRESSSKQNISNLSSNYTFKEYPESLKKKVILLQHFKSYLDGVKFEVPEVAPYQKVEYEDVFLKKWRRAKKALLFRLSNKVIQVVFQDVSELILSSGSGNVTFITSKREVRNTPLYQDLEKKDPSLFKRLNYAKEILVHMINPSKTETELNEKENKSRDGAVTSRVAEANMFSKLKYGLQNHKSAFETEGLVSSRSRDRMRFQTYA